MTEMFSSSSLTNMLTFASENYSSFWDFFKMILPFAFGIVLIISLMRLVLKIPSWIFGSIKNAFNKPKIINSPETPQSYARQLEEYSKRWR